MSVNATIGEDDISADVVELLIWLEHMRVGRWEVLLKNLANKWGGDFNTNDAVELKVDDETMLKGYVDDVIPHLNKRGVYTNQLKAVGRDYARDLARLYYSSKYVDKEADDVIDDLLLKTGSEITYTSPSTAPLITMSRMRTFLIDWLKDIVKRPMTTIYDAYVDQAKALHYFPVGHVSEESGITLKSVAGALDNNILDLEKGEQIGASIKNCIEFSAGSLNDHWSELEYDEITEEGWTAGANTILTHDTTQFRRGTASLKMTCNMTAILSMTLDFTSGLYSRDHLDMSPESEMSFYSWHSGTPALFWIRPVLEDGDGNVIEFKRLGPLIGIAQKGRTLQGHRTVDNPYKLQIPIGEGWDNKVKDAETNNRWYYTTKVTTFDWSNVKKLTIKCANSVGAGSIIWIDHLSIPTVEVISIQEDKGAGSSQELYGKSMHFERRTDLKSQKELDRHAALYLKLHKDVLRIIRVWAKFQKNSKYTGQSVDVHAPGHGIATATKYRIVKLHHRVAKNPIMKGCSAITVYDLLKHTLSPDTQVIDPLRFNLLKDPVAVAVEVLAESKRQLQSAETSQLAVEFGDTHPPSETVPMEPPDAPSGFDATDITTDIYVAYDGTVHAKFTVTIPRVTDAAEYGLRYRINGESVWQMQDIDQPASGDASVVIYHIKPNTTYQFQVCAKNELNRYSDWVPETPVQKTSASKSATPTTPTGLSATSMVGGILLKWNRVADPDTQYYAVYRHTSDVPGSATLIAKVDISWFFYVSEDYGQTYFFWVKTVDSSGNESAFSSSVSGASTKVDTPDLADWAVETAKIANAAVEEAKLASGAATEAKIATGAITNTKISDNAVTSPKIQAGEVEAGHIVAGAIETEKIATGAVVAGKIAAGAIITAKLDALAVTSDKIAANAIITGKIDAGAVTTDKLDAGAVTAAKIAAGAIETAKLDAGAVTAEKIETWGITADQMATDSIDARILKTGEVLAGHITVGELSAIKNVLGTITSGKIAGADFDVDHGYGMADVGKPVRFRFATLGDKDSIVFYYINYVTPKFHFGEDGIGYADDSWTTFSPKIPKAISLVKQMIQTEIERPATPRTPEGRLKCHICGKLLHVAHDDEENLPNACTDPDHWNRFRDLYGRNIGKTAYLSAAMVMDLARRVEALEGR